MNEQLLQRIQSCPTLPSLPSIAVQVLKLAQSPQVDLAEIAAVISKDPALSGKILKTVNSSFYGRTQAVSTVSHALVILGIQSVKTLVLSFSLVTNLNKSKGFRHLDYWRRSIYSATAARLLAAKLQIVQQEEAFLAALLHDIGMLVLEVVLGDDAYGSICANAKSHEDLAKLEEKNLGANHAEVGGVLAKQWKLPPVLEVPIGWHERCAQVTDPTLRKLTEVVALAAAFTERGTNGDAAPLSLIMLDLDHFKNVNDTHGHQAGDDVLKTIGRIVKAAAVRAEMTAARFGGEEFALLLPKVNRGAAAVMAEMLRKVIGAKPLKAGGKQLPITASLGVATADGQTPFLSAAQLIKAADLALYHAKASNRNCVKVFSAKAAGAAGDQTGRGQAAA
jgi:diguanylate cyclase (GGDEF)-like protein